LHDDGALLVLYLDYPKNSRQISAYLVANNFQVFQKWIICNPMLKVAQPLDPTKKVIFLDHVSYYIHVIML
jgi:hypothetical protein